MVFAISIVGIVVSATVNLSLIGRGRIRRFSGTEVSGEDRPSEDASRKTLCLLGCGRVVLLSFHADCRIKPVAHRRRLRHAVRQQGAGVVSRPHRAAQHGVGRRENVFVAKPGARTGQPRGGSLEP